MKSFITCMAVAGLMVTGNAMAADMPDLAKKNGCAACHSIDKKMVGPAWADVAKKYQGDKSAETQLVTKVSKGGSGVWGKTSMPALDPSGKKQDDIKQLVKFILALSK